MAPSAFHAVLVALLFTINHAIAQDKSPGGPTQPGTAPNCNAWHTVKSGDSCWQIEQKYGITHENFLKWNPAVNNDCSVNFWANYAYCVGVGAQATSSTTSVSSSSSSSSSSSVKSSSTISSSSTTINATYSTRLPITSWNVTTPTMETEFPPKRTQAGQPSYCRDWHYVSPGDTCQSIVGSASWVTMKEFLEWNPELHSDCSGLFVGWWVCIGIKPQSVTATFDYTTTIPPVVVPPKTGEYTPTTFPAVNSSFTASPTLDGQAKDCEAFYQAQSGDTCRVITNRGFPSEKQFFEWNPALKGNCDGLWAGYWYCVAVKGARPMPPRVTSLPSPVPTGQPSNCNSWYQTTSTETCDDIVSIFVAFSKEDFIKWNPSVGPKCDGIQKGLYYCVGVPGTPTTRTGPVPTATAPTETPTQSGIAPTCNNFWLVSSSDTCESISNRNGISVKQFYIWNPAVGTSTCDHLVPNTYVCVGVGNGSTSMSVTSGPTTTAKTTSTTGISSVTSSDKPSTTSGGAVATPAPVQAGMVTGCRRFYKAQSGDNCWAIANSAKIDLNDFYKWNPSVGTDCKNLWLDYWYCIGIAGPVTTISTGAPVPT